jgi:hypothetical protein
MSELTDLCIRLDRLLAVLEKPERPLPIFETVLLSGTHEYNVDYKGYRYLYMYCNSAITLSLDAGEFTANIPAQQWVQTQFRPGARIFVTGLATPTTQVAIEVQCTNDKINTTNFSSTTDAHVITDAGSVTAASITTLGQQLAAASVPVVLTAAQLASLTPPAAITNFALESGGNLDAIETDIDTLAANSPALGTAVMAGSEPITIATDDTQFTSAKNSLTTLAGGVTASVYQMNEKTINGTIPQMDGASTNRQGVSLYVQGNGAAGDTAVQADTGGHMQTIPYINGGSVTKANAMPTSPGAPIGTPGDVSATGTNAIVTATLAAVAAKTWYLTGYEITGLPATALSSGDVTISGLLNTLTQEFAESVTGQNSLIVTFNPPRPASAVNTSVSVAVAALGASSSKVAVNIHGQNF